MKKNKEYVNKVLDVIRMIDARVGFPRHMSSFEAVMSSLMNETEFLVLKEALISTHSNWNYLDKMSKTSYYKILSRVYMICATYITNNIEVIGL